MNRRQALRLAAFLLAYIIPGASVAAGRIECRTVRSQILGRQVRYCALLPSSYDTEKTRRYPVLYYLHGLGDNEQTLVNSGGWNLVENLREQGRIGEFLIVTPDGGRGFYVNSRDGRERYEDFFVREFIPQIERRYRVRATRASRGISGTSMGGYGALRFAFRYPQLFISVGAHMAVLAERLPTAIPAETQRLATLRILSEVFGSPLDGAFWEENNPFALASKSNDLRGLKIYLDCGREDDYGFASGAQALHERLKALGVPHEFHLYPGRHDWFYVASHLGDSLEFHSRAFGLRPPKL